MDYNEIYIDDNGKLILAKSHPNFCSLYAAVGYTNTNAGDLYAVMCGPQLWPAYDKDGKRINVGEDKAWMSYDEREGWYNE